MRFSQRRPLTLAQQYVNLRSNPVCAGAGTLQPARLVWRYSTAPTPISRDYDIRIDFRQGATPQVFVDAPDLSELAQSRRLPHVYEQKPPRLCLYLPRSGQWGNWMRIDLTLVPWTSLWLYYFEDWLASGSWRGGGVHPHSAEPGNDDKSNPNVEFAHA